MRRLLLVAALLALIPALAFGLPRNKRQRQAEIRRAVDLMAKGAELQQRERWQQAIEPLEKSRAMMESPAVLYRLGLSYRALGEYPQAVELLGRAVELSPDYPEAIIALRETRQESEAFVAGIPADEPAPEATAPLTPIAEGDELTTGQLIAILFPEGEEAPTLRLPGRLTDASSPIIIDTYQWHVAQARSFIGKNLNRQAADAFEQALKREPGSMDALLGLAEALAADGRTAKAEKILGQAREQFADSPLPLLDSGNFYRSIDRRQAIEYYLAARALDPEFAAVYNSLGIAYVREKEYDKAIEVFTEGIAKDPANAKLYRNLGTIYERQLKDGAKALELYRKYVELGGQDEEEVRRWIGELQSQTGQ